MNREPERRRRQYLPMGAVIGISVAMTVFAGLVAFWMYWLAGAFLPALPA